MWNARCTEAIEKERMIGTSMKDKQQIKIHLRK
jgi:hypothetical protein